MANPTDIARETLKVLATRRMLPTPENYQKVYHEVAGTAPEAPGLEELQKIVRRLAEHAAAAKRPLLSLDRALGERQWTKVEEHLAKLAGGGADTVSWPDLIRELLKQWQTSHSGLTTQRKREGVEQVLIHFGSDPAMLGPKLQALVASWGQSPEAPGGSLTEGEALAEAAEAAPPSPAQAVRGAPQAPDGAVAGMLRDLVVQTLEHGVVPRLARFPDLADGARSLVARVREATDVLALQGLSKELKALWVRIELRGEDDAELLASVLSLLRLLLDNVAELVSDDQWLAGQIDVVRKVMAGEVDRRSMFEAERRFKEVLYKQGTLKKSLDEAKSTFKHMIATFVDRLGQMAESTSGYHDKISVYSERISATETIHQLSSVVHELMADTRGMQLDIARSRDELIETRRQVDEAERKVHELELELERVSGLVRSDQLTGTLNRRGLEDAFERELARAARSGAALSLALLDVDHFKRLNDRYGHQAGDAALVHLARVVQETLRPVDVVARYGGEEFIIVMPETPAADAVKAMTRLQRELTKRFFLHNQERLLITFSAGVAQWRAGEPVDALIARADQAVYEAKEHGRNRVVLSSA